MLFCLSHVCSACENHMESIFRAELTRRLLSVFSIMSESVKSCAMEVDSAVIVERAILKRCLEALNKVEYGKFNCLQGFGSSCTSVWEFFPRLFLKHLKL